MTSSTITNYLFVQWEIPSCKYVFKINLKHHVRLSANGIAEISQRVALAIDSLNLIVMLFGCFDLSQAQKLQQQTSGVFLSKVCALTNN